MPYRPPPTARSPFLSSPHRAMTTAIGRNFARYTGHRINYRLRLRQLLKKVPCFGTRHSCNRPRRSHEIWLTDDEPRRIAEISLHFLSSG